MVHQCGENDLEILLEFLNQEAVYNTFLISDIECHGFDKPYQEVHMQTNSTGDCVGVYLRYYHNLILAGNPELANFKAVERILQQAKINTVMGKSSLIEKLHKTCFAKDKNQIVNKLLYVLQNKSHLLPANSSIETATMQDVDDIYNFLMSIPTFEKIYAEKEMIINRLKFNEGVHMFLKQDGKIIAHANSAAKTKETNMIGGIAVKEEERKKGYGKQVVSALCGKVLGLNRKPCLFSDFPKEKSLFTALGFEVVGNWGVLS